VFGRKRKQQELEDAAREAERHALFEELAKRPDTICPFLGLEDSRTDYRDRVSDAHRCYAFGDPAELSAEQQQKVCLQRGYGNCPRYLRGVLVIPTEELEALRRPQPAPPPQTATPRPVPAPATPASRGRRRAIVAILGVLLLAAAGGGAGYLYLANRVPDSTATASLPAGTDVAAELLRLTAPSGGEQQLQATASIGETEATPRTALIYVIDLSFTTLRGAGCGGDANGDGQADTPLDCELAAATALNEQAVANGTVSEVGIVGFAAGAVTADLGPAEGPQLLAAPNVDEDANGTPDVVEAITSAFSGRRGQPVGFAAFTEATTNTGFTAFSAGVDAACRLLAQTSSENRVVVLLSDGRNNSGEPVAGLLPCGTEAVFQTFAAGPDAICAEASELGSLQDISQLTGGTCTAVVDLTQLPQILEAVVLPQLLRVELTIDDGDPIDITNVVSPALPEAGPADVSVVYSIPALAPGTHRLCMTVHASDAGGPGSVTSCADADADGGSLTSG
jgi:hypothetical protein